MATATKTKAEPSTAADLRALLHEAERALRHTAGDAGDKFDELRDRLRAAADQGKYSLDELRAAAGRRARQADLLVRENPYYAAGIAAGIGAVVGILVARGCSSSR